MQTNKEKVLNKESSFENFRFRFSITTLLNIAFVMFIVILGYNFYLSDSNGIKAQRFVSQVIKNGGFYEPPLKNENNRFSKSKNKKQTQIQSSSSLYKNVSKSSDFSENKNFLSSEYINFESFPDGFRNYCSVLIDSNNSSYEFIKTFAVQPMDFSPEFLVYKALSYKNQNKMRLRNFHGYNFTFSDYENRSLLVILDRKNDFMQEKNFAIASVVIFALSLLFSYVISWTISLSVMNPIYESIQNQRRFIADASHELKTPIAVISANISVLQQEFPQNKWISYIKTENERMSTLVKELIYLAKDDAGNNEFNMTCFDLAGAIKCAVLPFESVAFESSKSLELDIPNYCLKVYGDEAKIKQLAVILLDNAFKNTEKDDLIRVSVGLNDSNNYFVKVYNTGYGIEKKDLNKIFRRFYRSDSSRTRQTGGYGLGLSIADVIANAHNGNISVSSEVNSFAEFEFTFPGVCKQKSCC